MTGLDEAAAALSKTTPLSHDQARLVLSAVTRGHTITGAQIDEMTIPNTETDPHLFMTAEGITKADLSGALREYRALDTWPGSPWADGETDVLSTDFINWYRWERL